VDTRLLPWLSPRRRLHAAIAARHPRPVPPLPGFGPPEPARLRAYRDVLERELDELLSFWARARDPVAGGYFTMLDRRGVPNGRRRYLVPASRLVWTFAAAHRLGFGGGRWLEHARHAAAVLEDMFWDRELGGWFWSASRSGEPVETRKETYAQSFGILATAELARASGSEQDTARALSGVALLEERLRHPSSWGFVEGCDRDWRPRIQHARELNPQLHLMEALTTVVSLSRMDGHLSLLRELRDLNLRLIDERGVLFQTVADDFAPLSGEESYGHSIEAAWMLLDANAVLGDGSEEPALALAGRVLEAGLDREHGGVYWSGPNGGRASDRRKVWWVQAEALLGFLRLYVHTRERRYWDAFERVLVWIVDHQVDRVYGEWLAEVSEDGGTILDGRKASAWKSSYHQARALMKSALMLRELEGV
jgi:mannobiose 2-epimerase